MVSKIKETEETAAVAEEPEPRLKSHEILHVGSLNYDNRQGRIVIESEEIVNVPKNKILIFQPVQELLDAGLIGGAGAIIGGFSRKLVVQFANHGNVSCGNRVSYQKNTGNLGTTIVTETKEAYCKSPKLEITKGTPFMEIGYVSRD